MNRSCQLVVVQQSPSSNKKKQKKKTILLVAAFSFSNFVIVVQFIVETVIHEHLIQSLKIIMHNYYNPYIYPNQL